MSTGIYTLERIAFNDAVYFGDMNNGNFKTGVF